MNIKEAKEQIKNAMTAYFSKDELGNYIIPIERQRPVFLVGAPGIGKTAIMEQIAQELGVALLSYSMTHHTRQSALGLPFISHKEYGGVEYDVSEYTMSEIIASVYDVIENSDKQEGILFLDEINCVSETLTPIMLQFLQYKVFGKHRVPNGWIVVTAGNPPEYNNSVREFDVVTLDRLKKIDVEPDFECWMEYAFVKNIHPAILTFLKLKKDCFYKIETTVDGKSFITARGWDDLSQMLNLYEKNKIKVDSKLICQYIQNNTVCKEFSAYYDLFNKYRNTYAIEDIMAGKATEDVKLTATGAKFDERLALLSMLFSGLSNIFQDVLEEHDILLDYLNRINQFKNLCYNGSVDSAPVLKKIIGDVTNEYEKGIKANSLSDKAKVRYQKLIKILDNSLVKIHGLDSTKAFEFLKKDLTERNARNQKAGEQAGTKLSNVFHFLHDVFKNGQEMVIFMTDLTLNSYTATFIGNYGCKEYTEYSKSLQLGERLGDIKRKMQDLHIDD